MLRLLFIIFIIPFSIIAIQPTNSFAQRKVKVVKVKKQGGVIKEGEQHFTVSKQGKEKNDKVTNKGRRFSNHNEAVSSVKKQHKRDKQLEKRRKNPSKKYTASANPKTKDAKKFNRKTKKEYRNHKKADKNSAKSRKATMKLNRKLSRE